jgi:branched-chain amino acid transport system permease protein
VSGQGIEIILNALMLSSMYILVASGFALVLNIMGILNFAHGALYMLGGYLCYQLGVVYGINLWLSLLLAAAIMALFGLFLERFCFRPFYGDFFGSTIVSIALILIIQTTINLMMGDHVRSLPVFVAGMFRHGGVSISLERLATAAIGVGLLGTLTLYIRKSKMGQQMLAVAQDSEGAELQGIRIHRVAAIAMGLGCALATAAGSFMGAVFDLTPFMGDLILVRVIQVVILSGIGSIGGVLVGGLVIGALDSILPLYVSPSIAQTLGLAVIIVVLLIRPRGLFGREAA